MAMGVASSARGRARARRAPMSEINVTPLVDVMLVLLIIFMITAPLLVAGVPVDLPESSAGALNSDDTPIQISVEANGDIYIDEQLQGPGVFPARLAAIRTARQGPDEPRVYIRADRALDYGRVMAVLGDVNAAGFRRVALVSEAGAREVGAADGQ
ncbi:ExbD/TolR family protein [Pacificimonas sp. WHA3]|uniref:ExbD/TolR family protein n=1 Tax=Pacificimonas pallii TaxID=2827236 RepID=A0ABS6SEA5_9SPHN|nr:ExbD/TolR family protein [Pacificimonas pallii]MBV7256246.1 ExbD/TolR family protein [Pacificimonas pallii]